MGWFEVVFNTPSHHRVHHGRNPKYIDKNHAGSLIIWDKMFGTFQVEEETPVYGVTKPTEHWDPVSAHIQPIVDMFKDLATVKGIKNKMAILFYPPGWFPSELGGRRFPPEVDKKDYKKFDVLVSSKLQSYLFIQSLTLLSGTAYFLFTYSSNSLTENIYWALALVFSIITVGLLFESRKIAWFLELARLILFTILTYFLVTGLATYLINIYLFASFIFIFKSRKELKR